MSLSRRQVLKSAGALPLLAGSFGFEALAQNAPAAPVAAEMPPILFVHGNGDHAALWITSLWRMESNGVPHDRMFAINFTDPLARSDDKVEQANRSSTEDQRDPRCTAALLQFLDGVGEFAALVLGRRTVRLFHLVVAARQRIGEVDGEHPLARHAVRFHPPQ